MTVVIAGPLRDRLDVIAIREGLTLQQLVATACGLLVESYNSPKPRRTRPARATITTTAAAPQPGTFSTHTVESTVAAATGMVTTMASGAVGLLTQPDHVYVAKRGPGRPRKLRPDPERFAAASATTRNGEHCGDDGQCLSARCVCRSSRL
jgi:hypothetical protein